MDLTRREFLKESLASLGFLALPGGLYAPLLGHPLRGQPLAGGYGPADWKPKKKAKLEVSLDRIDKIDNRGKAANGKNPVNPVNPVKKRARPARQNSSCRWQSRFARLRIRAGKKLTIAVRPVSSLATKGKTIGTAIRV